MTKLLAMVCKKMNPAVLAAAEKKAQKILDSMPLYELRLRAKDLTVVPKRVHQWRCKFISD